MDLFNQLINEYLLLGVFVAALADQGGLPIPGLPILVAASAQVASQGDSIWPVILVAIAGNLTADVIWFTAGRRLGPRVLGLLCRISRTPTTCVANTRRIHEKWGVAALIITKFVPGISAIAVALAGDSGIRIRRFLVIDAVGAVMWASIPVMLGAIFPSEVLGVLQIASHYSVHLLIAIGVGAMIYRLYKKKYRPAAIA